jgi:NHLM bacteriocin system ABC transporter ATP-binding protein
MHGNHSILLEDPGTIYIVQSGSMALFVVPVTDHKISGARRHLFTVTSRDLIFGSPISKEGHLALLAVTLEETELFCVEAHNIEQVAHASGKNKVELISGWIQKLNASLDGSGNLKVPDFDNSAGIPGSIAQLHSEFFRQMVLLEQRDKQRLAMKLKEREHLHENAAREALDELGHVIQPDFPSLESKYHNPFIEAAQAVCKAAGIEISLPLDIGENTDPENIIREIERCGHIRTRRVALSGKWWRSDCGPMLAYKLSENQPIALLPKGPRRYMFFDPATEKHIRVNRSTALSLHPFAYIFYRPLPDRQIKPLDVLNVGLKGTIRDAAMILVAALAATFLGMFTPVATSVLIDSAIPDSNYLLLMQLGAGLIAAAFGKTFFDLSQGFATTRIGTMSVAAIEAAIWDRVLKLRPSFVRQYSTGDLFSRAMAIGMIHRRLSATTLRTIFSSFVSVLNLALMFYYSTQLALIGIAAAIVTILVTLATGRSMLRKLQPLQQMEGKILGLTVQLINGISKLRVSGSERFAFAHWGKRYSEQQKLVLSVQKLQDHVGALNATVPTLASSWIFLVAGSLFIGSDTTIGGGLSTGIFLAFNVAFGAFIGGMSTLSDTAVETLDDLNLWRRAKPILSAEPESNSSKSDPGIIAGRIAMEYVTFRYRDSGPLTIEDVCFHAQPGEFIAFVGPSGSGKSTLFRLLLGFELPQSGTIYYDGQDLNGLDPFALRRQLGVVLQNSNLLSGSIIENIAAGTVVTLDQAWEAVQKAGIAEDIAALPMGMHTFISEGATNISVGQRQRLLIARALVFNPRILLFDEATSALDNRAQAIVSESLEQLHVTRLVIAHRLSTVRNADRIYVIEQGRVAQNGTFAELASQDGLFARMMSRQML